MENANSPEYLEKIKNQVIENLRRTAYAPSVAMTDVPRDSLGMNDEEEEALDDQDEDENKDVRYSQRRHDKHITDDADLSDSDDEDMKDQDGVRPQPNKPKRRNIMDYQNPNSAPDYGIDSGMGTPEPSTAVAAAGATAVAAEAAAESLGVATDPTGGSSISAAATAAAAEIGKTRGESDAAASDDANKTKEEDMEDEDEAVAMDMDDSGAAEAKMQDGDLDAKMDQDEQESAKTEEKAPNNDDAEMEIDENRPTSKAKLAGDGTKPASGNAIDASTRELSSEARSSDDKNKATIEPEDATFVTSSNRTIQPAQVTPPESPPSTSAPVASGEMAGQQKSNAPGNATAPGAPSASTALDEATSKIDDNGTTTATAAEDKDVEMGEADELVKETGSAANEEKVDIRGSTGGEVKDGEVERTVKSEDEREVKKDEDEAAEK